MTLGRCTGDGKVYERSIGVHHYAKFKNGLRDEILHCKAMYVGEYSQCYYHGMGKFFIDEPKSTYTGLMIRGLREEGILTETDKSGKTLEYRLKYDAVKDYDSNIHPQVPLSKELIEQK